MNKKLLLIFLLSSLVLHLGCGSSSVSSNIAVSPSTNIPTGGGDPATIWSSVLLTNIEISSTSGIETLNPGFSKDISTYTLQVPNPIDSITLTPTAEDQYATVTVKIDGTVVSRANSYNIALVAGVAKTIEIQITSGSEEKTYSITVIRELSSNANLSSMEIKSNGVSLITSPSFHKNTIIYSATVPITLNSISIEPVLEDTTATLEANANGNSIALNSGDNYTVNLNQGYNIINIIVTAQNNIDKKSYTIVITRGNTDANLSNIQIVNDGNTAILINPSFDENTTNYSAQLESTDTSVIVTAVSSDPNAEIEIDGTIVSSGFQSNNIIVNSGVKVIPIKVTSSDLSTQKTYTIFAVKP